MVRRSTILFAIIIGALVAMPAFAAPTWYMVTGENVQVRCGADSTYYAFTTAEKGTLVAVTGEKYNWARVSTVGSNFDDAWGYVKYPTAKPGRFELGTDGATGMTLGATPVLAPNLNADDIAHSWRQLCILPQGEQLVIMETFTVEEDALHSEPHTVHRVKLPSQAEGWINMADLKLAAEEVTPEPVIEEVLESDVVMGTPVQNGDSSETPAGEDEGITLLRMWVDAAQEAEVIDMMIEEEDASLAQETVETVEVEREKTHLEILEDAYEGVTIVDLDPEELVCLHEEYLAASETEPDPFRAEYARIRARQIEVFASLNDQEVAIERLKTDVSGLQNVARDQEVAIGNTGEYEVVGLLENSMVFNGGQRPMLYRIRDPRTGRTLAYMQPDGDGIAAAMLGQHIGVMGLLAYDPQMQVNIVRVARMDLLASNTAFVQVD